ncbi:MAG TPA: Tim44-like domain-containing protein, partial [Burkholderiaceae bacterium]|nr:Tim44-like domain-containing protein [Burkholderiaceae bacterium]
MKNWLMGAVIGVLATTFAFDVEAQRRFGGGRNLGRPSTTIQKQQTQPPAQQQQAPQQQANPQAAPQQQAAQPGAAAGAAARPASPWRGALMGLAAGLGIAALASWLGFSETLAAVLTAVLIALAVMLVIGFILRRLRGPQPAYQGASPSGYTPPRREPTSPVSERAALPAGVARPGSAMDEFARGAPVAQQQWSVPANFDTAGFLGHAKRHFTRLQQAWDRGDLAELEEFTTPQMFTELTHELHGRQEATRTDGVDVDAALLGIESTPADYLASVRFSGTVRVNGDTERVDEVWNFTKP